MHILFGVPRIFSFLMGLVLESRVDLGCFKILPCIILYLLKCNNPNAPYSFETSWLQRQALYRNFNIRHFWGIFVPVLLHVTFNNNLSNESFQKHLFHHYSAIVSVSYFLNITSVSITSYINIKRCSSICCCCLRSLISATSLFHA